MLLGIIYSRETLASFAQNVQIFRLYRTSGHRNLGVEMYSMRRVEGSRK